ncbi:MAG: hypothetical protein HZA81_00340 [Candidatus Taylorbacteria bacterium]|nr:hypothetical protein [Candidatus Taylorbacteria bacterium]
MLIKQPQIRIATRKVALWNGEAALAFFALINIEGAVEVKFLGTRPIEARTAPEEAVLALPEAFRAEPLLTLQAVFLAYVAPYISTLCFLVSQPARAPNVA